MWLIRGRGTDVADGRVPGGAPASHEPASVTRTRTLLIALFFACSIVLLSLLRFNWRETVPLPHFGKRATLRAPGDSACYTAYVEWFRGREVGDRLYPPFSYRPLAPWMASHLPFDAMTSLNFLNILALLVALTFLDRILAGLGCSRRQRYLGAALFVFSFPTFYYSTLGYVDPVGIAFLMAGVHFALRGKWSALAVVTAAGTLAKETMVLVLPVAATRLACDDSPRVRRVLVIVALCACYLITTLAVRDWSPGPSAYVWAPTLHTLQANLARPGAWATSLLTFGLPGVLALLSWRTLLRRDTRQRHTSLVPLLFGLLSALAAFVWSAGSAYTEGRFVWLSYPFLIPVTVLGWGDRKLG